MNLTILTSTNIFPTGAPTMLTNVFTNVTAPLTGFGSFSGFPNFVGPGLLASFVNAFQTGFLANQSISFWSYSHSELLLVRVLVVFVTFIALMQTILGFFDTWNSVINNFGNWVNALVVSWPSKIQPVINVLMAAPVQSFLIWRCWLLAKRNLYVLFGLSILLVGSIVMAITVTVNVFKVNFSAVFNPGTVNSGTPPPPVPIDPYFVSCLTIPVVLDTFLTTILLNFLLRSRNIVVSRRFRKTLRSLTKIVWEAALPPTICALITLITYLTLSDCSFWDLFFQAILGQLYVISLFVTLNGFRSVRERESGSISPTTALGMSWGSHGGIDALAERTSRSRGGGENRFEMHAPRVSIQNTPEPLCVPITTGRLSLTLSRLPAHSHHVVEIKQDKLGHHRRPTTDNLVDTSGGRDVLQIKLEPNARKLSDVRTEDLMAQDAAARDESPVVEKQTPFLDSVDNSDVFSPTKQMGDDLHDTFEEAQLYSLQLARDLVSGNYMA